MSETRRLYYENVYTKEFTAVVVECRAKGKDYEVILDQTVFYPEGGGQPGDHGVLRLLDGAGTPEKEVSVKDTREGGETVLHIVAEPLTPGTKVRGVIDWERRFDLMQQHSGEHIISGLIHEKYGYDNVGFHMSSDVVTVDFSGLLDMDQLLEIERAANKNIWENHAVEITYPSKEELSVLPYRSKKELSGKVRIVRFPGADLCACCGTHVTHTGEIGMVKFLTVENFHEGVRVTMISGKRVQDYLAMVNDQNHRISVKLSAKNNQTAAAVERLQEENFRLKGRISRLADELCAMEAARCADAGSVLLFHDGLEADQVRRMADSVMHKCAGVCAVFSANGDGSYKYAIGEQDGDLRQFTKDMNAALNGRGGGKPFFVQGSVKASEEEIRRFFEQ